ncbi:MAG TPA: CaiB/BaiF CoA-transferase family protein [Burkholderiales bacterium]|nr:CaiB/BaiF CoA-transferase family protein [Burkholderiales bacterium]
MDRPLSHVRVLDLTRVLAGPWAAQNLADLGAEVIKVERPKTGDDTRSWGPPWLKGADGADTREAAYFLSVNRGKKSVTVDLSKPQGQRLVRDLAAKSDVLIENYKVGDLARYGLAYDDVRQVNPRIIYCSVTGFGQDGPYAQRPGYDFVFQGMCGLMSITGERDELPGGGPQKVGIAVTDVLTGMYASLAITAAIAYRQLTGVGQYIDMALLDTLVAFNANQILNFWCSGEIPKRYGNAHANIVPYEVFPSADGHIILAVGNDSQFASFCRVAGRPELAEDPRFRTNPERVKHRPVLVPIVQEIVRARTSHDWIESLEAASVPCGPINNMREVFENPQVRHRGMRVEIPHPSGIPCPTVASPMRFSATPVDHSVPPPLLGQHTREVLGGVLGLSAAEIDALAEGGII